MHLTDNAGLHLLQIERTLMGQRRYDMDCSTLSAQRDARLLDQVNQLRS